MVLFLVIGPLYFSKIVLPLVPVIGTEGLLFSISLVKDTSLAATITVGEMFLAAQKIVSRTWETFPIYLELAFVYLLFCTVLTWLQHYLEKKMELK